MAKLDHKVKQRIVQQLQVERCEVSGLVRGPPPQSRRLRVHIHQRQALEEEHVRYSCAIYITWLVHACTLHSPPVPTNAPECSCPHSLSKPLLSALIRYSTLFILRSFSIPPSSFFPHSLSFPFLTALILYPSLFLLSSFSLQDSSSALIILLQSSAFCPQSPYKPLISALILYPIIFILPSCSPHALILYILYIFILPSSYTRAVNNYLLSVLILYLIIFILSAPYDSVLDCYSWSIRAPAPAGSTCQGVDLNRNWDVRGELTLAELLPLKLREEKLRQKNGIMEGSKLGFRKHKCVLLYYIHFYIFFF